MPSKLIGCALSLLLLHLVGVRIAVVAHAVQHHAAASGELEGAFQAYKFRHLREYANDDAEHQAFLAFKDNVASARRLQSMNPHASFGDSPFMDMPASTFRRRYLTDGIKRPRPPKPSTGVALDSSRPLPRFHPARGDRGGIEPGNPAKWDWRPYGVVTPVKNQGDCGSCWAFSTTGNIEGQWKLARGALVSLSEQDLVSCCLLSFGCNGGDPDLAIIWAELLEKGRIATEESYPYVSGHHGVVPKCRLDDPNITWGATVDGFHDIPGNETIMAQQMWARGPISVPVNATAFQTYTGGIMSDCDGSWLPDHVVLIVGYDDTFQPPYWIIKNSWGAHWGESGYLRLAKGTDQCDITFFPSTADVPES